MRIPELVAAVGAAGMPAVAVTDQNNLFAMVKFYREALKSGVKPLIGVDLLVREEGERAAPSRLTLLCQIPGGLPQSHAPGEPRLSRGPGARHAAHRARLAHARELPGLIALSGASDGDVGRALVNARESGRRARCWTRGCALFPGRYYLELQRLGRAVRGGLHRRAR